MSEVEFIKQEPQFAAFLAIDCGPKARVVLASGGL